VTSVQPQYKQSDADSITRVGAWLFERRTIIPVPLILALLLARSASRGPALVGAGVTLVALGEAVRLWAVRHIGVISRTRRDRLGPLVTSGPFALVRNPLYLGNVGLWVGFALCANAPWLAPVFAAILAFEYHAIVRWEERLLEERLGERYRAYAAEVPRWIPLFGRSAGSATPAFSWRDTLYSERGTLIAIAIGFGVLYLKQRS
jgi:protein-S-isoprenylcysteine O-methyltransferase Ste14